MAKRKRTTQPAASALPEPTGPVLVSTPEEARALIRRTSARKKQRVVYTEDPLPDGDEPADVENGKKKKGKHGGLQATSSNGTLDEYVINDSSNIQVAVRPVCCHYTEYASTSADFDTAQRKTSSK